MMHGQKTIKFISWNMIHGIDKLLTACNSAQEASLYETWKMELDTGSYLPRTVIDKVLTSLNTVQTTHYMQHVTKYSLHGKLDT
jgi:hypothetical protein